MNTEEYTQPKRLFRFWLKSSRGTNRKAIVELENWQAESEDDVKAELESWCSKFGAWHVSENALYYGFDEIKDDTEYV